MIDTLKGGQEQHTDEGGRITRGRDWGLKLYTTEHMGTSEWGGTGKTLSWSLRRSVAPQWLACRSNLPTGEDKGSST